MLAALKPWVTRSGHDWNRQKIGHLLRRTSFGASLATIDRAGDEGVQRTLDRIFSPEPTAGDIALDSIAKTVLRAKDTDALGAWWLQRMVQTGDPLREKCALMWHGHFATSDSKVQSAKLLADQYRLFREHGLGDLRILARAVTRDCAMLRFLDGNRNRKNHPNENFAREIFELFLLGIGNYSERDVRDAARAFTGYREENGQFVFRKDLHDSEPKTIFGRTGKFTGDDVVDLCFEREECATFLAKRITKTFLAPTPQDHWGEDIDRKLGIELRNEGFHVGRFLRRLFASEIFFAPEHYRSIVKSPIDYAVGALRSLDARLPGTELHEALTDMGQRVFDPPGVQGWSGGATWLSSARMVARNRFAARVAKLPTGDDKLGPTEAARLLLDDCVTESTRAALNNVSGAELLHTTLMLPEAHVA